MMKYFYYSIILLFMTSCELNFVKSDLPQTANQYTPVVQFDLIPDNVNIYKQGQNCLSEIVNSQTIYYSEYLFKQKHTQQNSTIDVVRQVFSDSACTVELYSIAYLRDLVSMQVAQVANSSDILVTTWFDVQMYVSDQSLLDSYNQINYLGITWVLNQLNYLIDRVDPSTNIIIYPSGQQSLHLSVNTSTHTITFNGAQYVW